MENKKFLFNKMNYILLITSVVLLALAAFLMSGKDDIYSTMKITIAPIVAMIGFIVAIVAIMHRTKAQD